MPKNTTPNMAVTSAKPPHNGAVTHHHDHAIYPVNFNVTNTIANKPKNPIPLELDELDDFDII